MSNIMSARGEGSTVRCECGCWSGKRCEWTGPRAETVIVEWMPEYLRASHTAANNRGVYPANGAQRIRVERSCADSMVEHDGDWCREIDFQVCRALGRRANQKEEHHEYADDPLRQTLPRRHP